MDLTHYISGPYCTKLMATMGAEVIKIERPGAGDPARYIGPFAFTGDAGEAEIPPAPLYERGGLDTGG